MDRNAPNMLSHRDVQLIGLGILEDVHDFCDHHNITYSLYGGSMLGAIRHKGFIPWDDDVDIAMPRKDYERFIKTYVPRGDFKLFCHSLNNSWLPFARICDIGRTIVHNDVYPWGPEEAGVWIDVFPLDGASDDIGSVQAKLDELSRINHKIYMYRMANGKFFRKRPSIRSYLVYIYSKLLHSFKKVDIYGLLEDYSNSCKAIAFGETSHYCNFSYLYYKLKEYQSLSDFNNMIRVKFENDSFSCIGGYDQHMRSKYGDYMTPPSEANRKGHRLYGYYWKNTETK